MERYGEDVVENFIDSCLSLENLIDVHSTAIKRREGRDDRPRFAEGDGEDLDAGGAKFQSKGYMDAFVNPPEVLKEEQPAEGRREAEGPARSPSSPSATCCCSCSTTPR